MWSNEVEEAEEIPDRIQQQINCDDRVSLFQNKITRPGQDKKKSKKPPVFIYNHFPFFHATCNMHEKR